MSVTVFQSKKEEGIVCVCVIREREREEEGKASFFLVQAPTPRQCQLDSSSIDQVQKTYPSDGANAAVHLLEILAGSELLTTSVDALVVVAVRLPAVLALVGVGEASVEGS